MFVDRTVPRINKDWQRFGFVREMKAQIGRDDPARDRRRALSGGILADAISRVLMTAIIGAAVGRLCHRVEPGENSDALARDTLEATLTGLRSGFARDVCSRERGMRRRMSPLS